MPLQNPLPMLSLYFIYLGEAWSNGILSYDPKRIFNNNAYQFGDAVKVSNASKFIQILLLLTAKNNPLSEQKLMDKKEDLIIIKTKIDVSYQF